jgi:hypothetical protein
MSTPATLARAALHAGRAAAERGDRSDTNPWNGTSDNVAGRVQAKMWRHGYQSGNPVQVHQE